MARQKDCKSFHVGSIPARASNPNKERGQLEMVIRDNKYSQSECAFLLKEDSLQADKIFA